MNKPISILLVDDHTLMRQMLTDRLAGEPDLQVVGTVEDADAAVAQAVSKKSDVIVMDIDMPGLSCFDASRTIQTLCP